MEALNATTVEVSAIWRETAVRSKVREDMGRPREPHTLRVREDTHRHIMGLEEREEESLVTLREKAKEAPSAGTVEAMGTCPATVRQLLKEKARALTSSIKRRLT